MNKISPCLNKLIQIEEKLPTLKTFDDFLKELNENDLACSEIPQNYLRKYFENYSRPEIGFFGRDYISKSLEKNKETLATEAMEVINNDEADFVYQVLAARDLLAKEKSNNEKFRILIKVLESPKKYFIFNNFSKLVWLTLFEKIEDLFKENFLKEDEKYRIKKALMEVLEKMRKNSFFSDSYLLLVFGDIHYLYLISLFEKSPPDQKELIQRLEAYISFQRHLVFFKKVNRFVHVVNIPGGLNFLVGLNFAEKILSNIQKKEFKKVFSVE
ncbi:MAG: hypothetical protein HQM08_26495 [Candidatus Riflebacteria bacterium]|nr:hypothetical protein [Candidatus Riflebacteria bacterium]